MVVYARERAKAVLRSLLRWRCCAATFFYIPPLQRLLAGHPTYNLLGFSAALAPKFPPKLTAMEGSR